MTNLILAVYFIGIFNKFNLLTMLLLIAISITTFIMILFLLVHSNHYWEEERNRIKVLLNSKFFKCLWVVAILGLLLPSKQAMYTMLGLYIGNEVITEVTKSPLYDKAYKLLEQTIDEQLQKENKK